MKIFYYLLMIIKARKKTTVGSIDTGPPPAAVSTFLQLLSPRQLAFDSIRGRCLHFQMFPSALTEVHFSVTMWLGVNRWKGGRTQTWQQKKWSRIFLHFMHFHGMKRKTWFSTSMLVTELCPTGGIICLGLKWLSYKTPAVSWASQEWQGKEGCSEYWGELHCGGCGAKFALGSAIWNQVTAVLPSAAAAGGSCPKNLLQAPCSVSLKFITMQNKTWCVYFSEEYKWSCRRYSLPWQILSVSGIYP